ncbi:hypothetical protein O6H91_04G126100, partial [Diphasiastrum complanatum]
MGLCASSCSAASPASTARTTASWAVLDHTQYMDRSVASALKERIQCSFEGLGSAEGCRYEDHRQQKGEGAIVGLHSSWVTPFILGMARPSDHIIKQYFIIYQFHSAGIDAILNLQEPGEHAACGHGIKAESGFSYTPELFMENKIFYYNFPWRDMQCPALDYSLRIVQVMDFHITRGGKVAVHCHSGL